jgi:hypothetical protein
MIFSRERRWWDIHNTYCAAAHSTSLVSAAGKGLTMESQVYIMLGARREVLEGLSVVVVTEMEGWMEEVVCL